MTYESGEACSSAAYLYTLEWLVVNLIRDVNMLNQVKAHSSVWSDPVFSEYPAISRCDRNPNTSHLLYVDTSVVLVQCSDY